MHGRPNAWTIPVILFLDACPLVANSHHTYIWHIRNIKSKSSVITSYTHLLILKMVRWLFHFKMLLSWSYSIYCSPSSHFYIQQPNEVISLHDHCLSLDISSPIFFSSTRQSIHSILCSSFIIFMLVVQSDKPPANHTMLSKIYRNPLLP